MVLLAVSSTFADESLRLDHERVVAIARERAPEAMVARARIGEARALRVGASAPALTNPEIGFAAGPRFFGQGQVDSDLVATIRWPIDVSGAPTLRRAAAEEQVRLAEEEAEIASRAAVVAALDLWIRALGASERVQLESERATLDEALVRVAKARRDAGAAGDADIALATVVQAEGIARLRTAEGERDSLLALLRGRLGLDGNVPISIVEDATLREPPPLESLVAALPNRPELKRSELAVHVAELDRRLQRRVGFPVPRLTLSGGRSTELFVDAELDVPLPIYQRNQTNAAVAAAHVETRAAERRAMRAHAESELRAVYAEYVAARAAFRALADATPALVDAEHLAARGYELGQGTLASVLIARREVANARLAHLDGKVALARARVAIDLAAGVMP
jgi:cobalt-zinc-cadmium efflux system outer membrane protein